ncbi:hypothetical protein E2C01_003127 [Portunus trituberculatus]|uniref:Uncharacterized protein n=1 Tax=Portunus trituberculatus TaxID=210409 RepID=A0A5B7CM40_PORTR|nr:hypothetical protein [Portunus trituberculatus]
MLVLQGGRGGGVRGGGLGVRGVGRLLPGRLTRSVRAVRLASQPQPRWLQHYCDLPQYSSAVSNENLCSGTRVHGADGVVRSPGGMTR